MDFYSFILRTLPEIIKEENGQPKIVSENVSEKRRRIPKKYNDDEDADGEDTSEDMHVTKKTQKVEANYLIKPSRLKVLAPTPEPIAPQLDEEVLLYNCNK